MFKVGLVEQGAADFSAGHTVRGPVSGAQAAVLGALHEARGRGEALRLAELAERLGLARTTVHYHVHELQRKGFVHRRFGSVALQLLPIMQNPSLDVEPD